ncbi:unnamed protein product [Haemonchus placei]|uniref:Uncharacterized protein n=1 Tax=Haemonchus placei TaxID=6290 RepID=A0A0N4WDP8_HAEPC|nr:unnamed protein product [Haemonchus placei]
MGTLSSRPFRFYDEAGHDFLTHLSPCGFVHSRLLFVQALLLLSIAQQKRPIPDTSDFWHFARIIATSSDGERHVQRNGLFRAPAALTLRLLLLVITIVLHAHLYFFLNLEA